MQKKISIFLKITTLLTLLSSFKSNSGFVDTTNDFNNNICKKCNLLAFNDIKTNKNNFTTFNILDSVYYNTNNTNNSSLRNYSLLYTTYLTSAKPFLPLPLEDFSKDEEDDYYYYHHPPGFIIKMHLGNNKTATLLGYKARQIRKMLQRCCKKYDSRGAMGFAIAVILFYGISIAMLVAASTLRRSQTDYELKGFLRSYARIEEERRTREKQMMRSVLQKKNLLHLLPGCSLATNTNFLSKISNNNLNRNNSSGSLAIKPQVSLTTEKASSDVHLFHKTPNYQFNCNVYNYDNDTLYSLPVSYNYYNNNNNNNNNFYNNNSSCSGSRRTSRSSVISSKKSSMDRGSLLEVITEERRRASCPGKGFKRSVPVYKVQSCAEVACGAVILSNPNCEDGEEEEEEFKEEDVDNDEYLANSCSGDLMFKKNNFKNHERKTEITSNLKVIFNKYNQILKPANTTFFANSSKTTFANTTPKIKILPPSPSSNPISSDSTLQFTSSPLSPSPHLASWLLNSPHQTPRLFRNNTLNVKTQNQQIYLKKREKNKLRVNKQEHQINQNKRRSSFLNSSSNASHQNNLFYDQTNQQFPLVQKKFKQKKEETKNSAKFKEIKLSLTKRFSYIFKLSNEDQSNEQQKQNKQIQIQLLEEPKSSEYFLNKSTTSETKLAITNPATATTTIIASIKTSTSTSMQVPIVMIEMFDDKKTEDLSSPQKITSCSKPLLPSFFLSSSSSSTSLVSFVPPLSSKETAIASTSKIAKNKTKQIISSSQSSSSSSSSFSSNFPVKLKPLKVKLTRNKNNPQSLIEEDSTIFDNKHTH